MASAAETRAVVNAAAGEANGAILSLTATKEMVTTTGVDINIAIRGSQDVTRAILEVLRQIKDAISYLRSISDGSANANLSSAIAALEAVEREQENDLAKVRALHEDLLKLASKIAELSNSNSDAVTRTRGAIDDMNAYGSIL